MRCASKREVLGAAVVALLIAVFAAPGRGEWKESEVQALTQRLLHEVSTIKRAVARDWDREDKQSPRYVVLDDLMTLHARVVALEGLVRAGQGPEKTAPVFRRVLTAVEHARRDAADFPEVQKQRAHIEAAEEAVAALEALYGPQLARLEPAAEGEPPPPIRKRSPAPKVAAAPPGKTHRRWTTEPAGVEGCPESVMHDVSMNRGGNVRIWVYPKVTGPNEVTTTVGVIMAEIGGHDARGELVEERVVHVPDLPPGCRIRRILTESLASCEFTDDDDEEDSAKCDIVRPGGLVRSVRVSAQSPGLDFDCDDAPGQDAYAQLAFNPIEVEVVCE